MDAIDRIKLTMEHEVISSLLAGNDTQCFTTDQYTDGRDRWLKELNVGVSREELGLGPKDEYDRECSRKQLATAPQLVKQIDKDIWAMADER